MASLAPAAQAADPRSRVTDPTAPRRPLVILGGGEHARVVAEAAAAGPAGWQVVGFSDDASDDAPSGREIPGVPRIGDDAALADRLSALSPAERPALVLGFGGPASARQATVAAATAAGPTVAWAVIIHPAASVSPSATIGEGAVILAGAVVNTGATIGRHAIVNSGAVVEHDVAVGDFAHIAPRAVVGGGARIGDRTVVGLGAAVRDHVVVGADVTVAMGAAVVGGVAAGRTVSGVPARERRRRD